MAKPELLSGERQERESSKAIIACNDYLRMGPGRSMTKLIAWYRDRADHPEPVRGQDDPKPLPPTRRLGTLKTWSIRFDWQKRAANYDAEIEIRKTEAIEARRREAMETGLALDYERVILLKHLAAGLADEIWIDAESGDFVQDKIWLPDVKQIGAGENAERVDIVRFNQSLLDEMRAVLDDLAKETGGRRQQIGLGNPDGGPIEFNPFAGLSDAELDAERERLERLEQRRAGAVPADPAGAEPPAAGEPAQPDPTGDERPADA